MKTPIKDRIAASIRRHGGFIQYHALAEEVFPRDQFPRAWNYPTRGGPPGCYMALSRAISRHGFYIHYPPSSPVVYSLVMMGRANSTGDGKP
jgi:hypothetical protein